MVTHEKLRALALASTQGDWQIAPDGTSIKAVNGKKNPLIAQCVFSRADIQFITACDPATVLALLDSLSAPAEGQP